MASLLLLSVAPFMAQAAEPTVKATADGISIDAGAAGVYLLSYPRLVNPQDGGATPDPHQVAAKPDGSGAVLTYLPSGKATLDKQADGSWLYHFTEIPADRVKFCFKIKLPLTLAQDGTTWSFDRAAPGTFPKVKGELVLYHGNPKTFAFTSKGAGFAFTYPQKTWTTLSDERHWGKDHFALGHILYFPGKKNVPEISYAFKVGGLPEAPVATPLTAPK